jgi:LEA14-like dessication related protein
MKKALLILGGLGLLGFGVYKYFKTQASLLKDFTWKIVGFKIRKITLSELSLDVTFLFTSKADIEATISKLYLDLFLEDTNVGFLTEEKSFLIPAHGSANIPLFISINPQYVLKNLINVSLGIAKSKDISFRLKGYANIKSGFISTTLPIDYKTTIKEYLGVIPTK